MCAWLNDSFHSLVVWRNPVGGINRATAWRFSVSCRSSTAFHHHLTRKDSKYCVCEVYRSGVVSIWCSVAGRVDWRMVQSLPREAVSRWDWGEAGAANTKRVNLQPGNEHWWPSSHAIFCLLALLFCRRQATTYCCRARVARKREPANFERGARSSFVDASP